MVIGFFPQEQPPGLREREEQKLLCECGARGFCHLCGWARCTPRISLQRAQLPSRPQTSCPELDPSLPSRRGAGGERTGHALRSRPLPACWRAHPSRSTERSSSLPGLVGLGRWIQTVLWAADRQIDNVIVRASFLYEMGLKMTPHPEGACPACLSLKYAKQRENTTEAAMGRLLIQDPQSNFSPTTDSPIGLQQII